MTVEVRSRDAMMAEKARGCWMRTISKFMISSNQRSGFISQIRHGYARFWSWGKEKKHTCDVDLEENPLASVRVYEVRESAHISLS